MTISSSILFITLLISIILIYIDVVQGNLLWEGDILEHPLLQESLLELDILYDIRSELFEGLDASSSLTDSSDTTVSSPKTIHDLEMEYNVTLLPPSRLELQALYDLYTKTNGRSWVWKHATTGEYPWEFPADFNASLHNPDQDATLLTINPCTARWQGIVCDCLLKYAWKYTHPYKQLNFYYDDYVYDTPISLTHRNMSCSIVSVNVMEMGLTGPISSSLGNLKNLTHLHVNKNNLTGPIIDYTLPYMKKLVIFGISHNFFTGTIPNYLPSMKNLKVFDINNNEFTGTIPSSVGSITKLPFIFAASYNALHGTIPSFNQGCGIVLFVSATQSMTGTLPSSVTNCKYMIGLASYQNQHTGTIPITWQSLYGMQLFSMNSNILTGPLPLPAFSKTWTKIVGLDFGSNFFTNTLPTSFALMPYLQQFSIRENLLIGTIPIDIFSSFRTVMLMDNNFFTGTIPNTLSIAIHLNSFYITDNLLVGTLPSLANLQSLASLFVSKNRLSGPLPMTLLTSLTTFAVNENLFTGSIPSWIWNSSLQMVLLSNNLLQGSILSCPNENCGINDAMYFLDISNNEGLTGSASQILTTVSHIQVFIAIKICFHDGIDQNLCPLISSLHTLVLDGTGCGNIDIPECIFQLPSLHTLQLSQTNLQGTLPIHFASTLTTLIVSHNTLRGNIPLSYQQHAWMNLDVSYNKLNGELDDSFLIPDSSSAIQLYSNRLSGSIPSSLQQAINISILDGNIFTCTWNGQDLPENDPNQSIYSCGTNMVNYLLFTWIAFFGLWLVSIVLGKVIPSIAKWLPHQLVIISHEMIQSFSNQHEAVLLLPMEVENQLQPSLLVNKIPHILSVIQCLIYLRQVIILFLMICIIFLLPIYTGLSAYYSVYETKYAYVVSAMYLSGNIPMIILLITWLLLVYGCMYVIWRLSILEYQSPNVDTSLFKSESTVVKEIPQTNGSSLTTSYFTEIIILIKKRLVMGSVIFIIILLLSMSLAVNMAFVYTQIRYNLTIRYLCQATMAIVKLVYTKSIVPLVINIFSGLYHDGTLFTSRTHGKYARIMGKDQWSSRLELMIIVCSNVIFPCIAVLLVDINCLYAKVFTISPISTSYSYEFCKVWVRYLSGNFECILYIPIIETTTFEPDFSYSYMCSSAIIANYVPVYAFMILNDTFSKSIFRLLISKFFHYQKQQKTNAILPNTNTNIEEAMKVEKKKKPAQSIRLHSIAVANPIINYGSILLSFGVMFPPLGVMLCIVIVIYVSQTLIALREEIGKILTMKVVEGQELPQLQRQNTTAELQTILLLLSEMKMMSLIALIKFGLSSIAIPLFCIFIAFFMFDIYGDSTNWESSWYFIFIVPTVLIINAIVLFVSAKVLSKNSVEDNSVQNKKKSAVVPEKAVEMQPVVLGGESAGDGISKRSETKRLHRSITHDSTNLEVGVLATGSKIADEHLTDQLELEETYEEVTAEFVGFFLQLFGMFASS